MLKKKLEKMKIAEKFKLLSLIVLVFLFLSVSISLVFVNEIRVGGSSYNELTGYHQYLDSLGELSLIFENQKNQIYFYRSTRHKRFNILKKDKVREFASYITRSSKKIIDNKFQGDLVQVNKTLKSSMESYLSHLQKYYSYREKSKKQQNLYFRSLVKKINKLQGVVYETKKQMGKTINQTEERINKYVQITIVIIFMLFGLTFLIVNLMTKWIRNQMDSSLEDLLEGAAKISHGDFNYVVPVKTEDEFGALTKAFNSMTRDLKRTTVHLDMLIGEIQKSKKLESQLSYAQSMAALGEMAGGIAHEINNPLAIITMNTDVLRMRLEMDKIDKNDFINRMSKIDKTVARIGRIIKGLQTFSRDGSRDKFINVSFNQVVEDTLELCSEKLKSSGIDLRFMKTSSEIEVDCSLTQLSQVFLNLLNNSRDAVEDLEEKWISIDYEFKENQLKIKFTDSGKGIDPLVLKRIFNPFYTTKAMGRGTGLGLSISKGIIESHGGKLSFDETNMNTSFVITLPAKRVVKEINSIDKAS